MGPGASPPQRCPWMEPPVPRSAPCAPFLGPRSARPSHLLFSTLLPGSPLHRTKQDCGGNARRRGSGGASVVPESGLPPLPVVESPTFPSPRSRPTGCRQAGRACPLLPPVPPPSAPPLSLFLSPAVLRPHTLNPLPCRRLRRYHLPAPCPRSDSFPDESEQEQCNPGLRRACKTLPRPCPCPLSPRSPTPLF